MLSLIFSLNSAQHLLSTAAPSFYSGQESLAMLNVCDIYPHIRILEIISHSLEFNTVIWNLVHCVANDELYFHSYFRCL